MLGGYRSSRALVEHARGPGLYTTAKKKKNKNKNLRADNKQQVQAARLQSSQLSLPRHGLQASLVYVDYYLDVLGHKRFNQCSQCSEAAVADVTSGGTNEEQGLWENHKSGGGGTL